MPATSLRIWSNELEADAARLVAFERWLRIELGSRLVWPADEARARRQIGQASAFVQRAVGDLGKRGWLFRPAELAKLLTDQLDHVATYQRKGQVRDLYKYLERAWDNWAGRNAEQLAEQARQQRVHVANIAPGRLPSMAEIVLRDLEAKDQEIRDRRRFRAAKKAARKPRCSDPAGPLLPGFCNEQRAADL